MFENYKAQRLFADLSESLEGEQKALFTKRIKALFEKKTVSEEGEYQSFKLSEMEVATIYDHIKFPISQREYDEHDCHVSPDDGCEVCVAWAEQNHLQLV